MTQPLDPVSSPDEGSKTGTATTSTLGGISRRGLLGGTAVAATVAGGAFVAGREAAASSSEPAPSPLERSYDFRGVHQAGVITPAQDRLHFASFDIITESRDELIAMLKLWTEAAERMTAGGNAGPIGPVEGPYNAPPDDTGEAIGLPPSGLTITFGFGPTMFVDANGKDRFGLADRQPAALQPLPHFPGDPVDLPITGGDMCVQACADDPQVAVHAVRNLARIGFGTVALRWSQLGFGRTSSTSTTQTTPRNLFGLKDGTMNVKAEETAALEDYVWVQPDDDPAGAWLEGGSYVVARRINMTLEVWDRQSLGDQESFIGRTKDSGAPLSGGKEFDQPDFEMQGRDGPIMPLDCHVRVVHPDHNGGMRMLRRGYNFVDGSNELGHMDAGLFFLAFMRDPRTQFIPIQNKMAQNDALVEYLKFNGSALFAVPPGIGQDEYVGQALFG